jgi:hypothetical protein
MHDIFVHSKSDSIDLNNAMKKKERSKPQKTTKSFIPSPHTIENMDKIYFVILSAMRYKGFSSLLLLIYIWMDI